MKKPIDVFAPRLALLAGLCLVLAFVWKFVFLALLPLAIGIYLYTHRMHDKVWRYGEVLILLSLAVFVYFLVVAIF